MIRVGDTLQVVRYTPGLRTGERLVAVSSEQRDPRFAFSAPVVLVQRPGDTRPLGDFWAFRFAVVPREVLG
jgi:hypothetical protein